MPDHVIEVVAFEYMGSVMLTCSCGWTSGDAGFITLGQLNDLAHKHIEGEEIAAIRIEAQLDPEPCPVDPTHLRRAHDPGGAWYGVAHEAFATPAAYVHGLDPAQQDPRSNVFPAEPSG